MKSLAFGLTVVLALVLFTVPSHGQEQETWDVDTIPERGGTSTYVIQDSALQREPIRLLCPFRAKRVIAVNIPPQAVCAFIQHAQDKGCASAGSPVDDEVTRACLIR
jgi:hypothetical protein